MLSQDLEVVRKFMEDTMHVDEFGEVRAALKTWATGYAQDVLDRTTIVPDHLCENPDCPHPEAH